MYFFYYKNVRNSVKRCKNAIKESLSNEKVKANIVFAAGDADDICSILKLKKEYYDRSRLHILRSRADYSMFDDFMDINEKKSGDVVTGQQSLF